ncbi:DUF63 domain-containing protein [Halobacteriales archaeon QH_9_66_26]|nr:MAG: DUF63 domain-containing protein [Halobacteriales archaeon QH_9_66_26]
MVPAQVLPEGSTLPPPRVLLVLAIALVGVVLVLRRIAPRVTDRVVVAFAPWMVAGSSCYVLYQVDAVPPAVSPFFSSPTVYASIAVLAGAVWAGTLAFGTGTREGLMLAWPSAGLVIAVLLAAVVWGGLRRIAPETRITGGVGALAVFGHTLDGVSTAVGIDVLGFGEQSPVSRAIITFAADLPTAPVLGAAWLFILVKLVLAAVVVVLMSGYVREEPAEGYLLLGAVAAVGLGPGAHNLLLFTIASP